MTTPSRWKAGKKKSPVADFKKLTGRDRRLGTGSDSAVDKHLKAVLVAQATGQPAPAAPKAIRKDVEVAAAKAQRKAWRFRHRKWLIVVYAALILWLSKILIQLSAVGALVGFMTFVGLGIAGVVWVTKVRAVPVVLPEVVKTRLADGVQKKITYRLSAILTVVAGAAWWVLPLPLYPHVLDHLLVQMLGTWVWLLGTAGIAGSRAHHFRVRAPLEPVKPVETREEAWAAHLGAEKGGKMPGSHMVGWEPVHGPDGDEIGWQAGIELPRGSAGASSLVPAARGQVATTYGVGLTDLMTNIGFKNERQFTLTVLDGERGHALDMIHPWTGSDFNEVAPGTYTLGPRADWSPALIELFNPEQGGRMGHVSGRTGRGKSETIENHLRSVTAKNIVVPLLMDLGDVTYIDWEPFVPVFETDPARIVLVLENLMEFIHHRQRKMRTMRRYNEAGDDIGVRRVYPIDPEHPFVMPVFDEWHEGWKHPVYGPRILRATEFITTQARKTMTGCLLATQSASLQFGFGNNSNIRTQVQGGYMIGHQNNTDAARMAFGGSIEVDLSSIPADRPGLAYLTSSAPGGLSDAMARSRWVQEPMLHNDKIKIPELPGDEMEILRKGLDVAVGAVAPPMPQQRQGEEPMLLNAADIEDMAQQLVDASTDGFTVEEATAFLYASGAVVPLAQPELSDVDLAVLAYVGFQEEPVARSAVLKHLEGQHSRDAIDQSLKRLLAAGQLVKPTYGKYAVVNIPAKES